VCFLVASALAWFEVCHGWAAWRPQLWAWWITLANLLGSVAFGVSAVAGYINPATGQLRNAERANLGTLVGAVCFLIGAILLPPERTEEVVAKSRHPVAISPRADADDDGGCGTRDKRSPESGRSWSSSRSSSASGRS
jgi:peptidoglycan/LPS O-acetylase OafA/YrhL